MSKEGEQKDMKNIEEKKESHIEVKSLDSKKIKPQLLINTGKDLIDISEEKSELVVGTFKETDKYSITPTTFKGRTLFNSKPIIDNINVNLEKIYIQRKNIDSELLNIDKLVQNLHSTGVMGNDELKGYMAQMQKPVIDPLKAKLDELQNYQEMLIRYQSFIKENDGLILSYQDTYVHKDNAIVRYGINVSEELIKVCFPIEEKMVKKKEGVKSKASSKSAKDEQDISLHPLEVLLIKEAVSHLSSADNVLVDIFARESDGKIKMQESKLETHTIVLHKNSQKEVVVIDPSNSDFSKHLASNVNKMFISGALGSYVDILVSPKQLKIYEPASKDNIGPNFDQYRDCIDIAVKIAFGLKKIGMIDVKKIESLDIIQEVTNQKDVNEYLFFSNKESIARIRQASDENIKKIVNKLLIWIDNQTKSITKYLGDKVGVEISENNIKLFQKQYVPGNYESGIKDFFRSFEDNDAYFRVKIDDIKIELQGEIKSITEINENISD